MSRLPSMILIHAVLTLAVLAQVPRWSVDHVGGLIPGTSTLAASCVNDSGTIAGITYLSGYKRAWVGSVGAGISFLPIPSGAIWSEPSDINAAGVISGRILLSGNVSRGVLWYPGPGGYQIFALPSGPGGTHPFNATSLNDRGDVVGKYGILGGSYHWSATGGITQITSSVFPVVPTDINNQRQIWGDVYRMDLDTMVLENLGTPVGTGFNYLFAGLGRSNDAGQAVGAGVTATSSSQNVQAIRYTDGPIWDTYNSIPLSGAGANSIAESGDLTFHLGIYGNYLYVEGYGSIPLQNAPTATDSAWDLSGSWVPIMSRGGLIVCNGINNVTNEAGIVLLRPAHFDDLGGASAGERGPPVLQAYGDLVPGSPARYRLGATPPWSWAYFLVATNPTPVAFAGGTVHAYPYDQLLPVQTDAFGRYDATVPWPLVAPGMTFYIQAVVVESGSFATSVSNAIAGTTR